MFLFFSFLFLAIFIAFKIKKISYAAEHNITKKRFKNVSDEELKKFGIYDSYALEEVLSALFVKYKIACKRKNYEALQELCDGGLFQSTIEVLEMPKQKSVFEDSLRNCKKSYEFELTGKEKICFLKENNEHKEIGMTIKLKEKTNYFYEDNFGENRRSGCSYDSHKYLVTFIFYKKTKEMDKSEVRCKNCGAKISPDTKQCEYCGSKIIKTENTWKVSAVEEIL